MSNYTSVVTCLQREERVKEFDVFSFSFILKQLHRVKDFNPNNNNNNNNKHM